jgi:hypothetical protein
LTPPAREFQVLFSFHGTSIRWIFIGAADTPTVSLLVVRKAFAEKITLPAGTCLLSGRRGHQSG